jgi:hypothetical protein
VGPGKRLLNQNVFIFYRWPQTHPTIRDDKGEGGVVTLLRPTNTCQAILEKVRTKRTKRTKSPYTGLEWPASMGPFRLQDFKAGGLAPKKVRKKRQKRQKGVLLSCQKCSIKGTHWAHPVYPVISALAGSRAERRNAAEDSISRFWCDINVCERQHAREEARRCWPSRAVMARRH